ncbi:MAG: tRNA (N6-isopentenyl adenosine(37)-C2)-methylthiotransferase MiaB [Pyrinomonadaceae bacterium]
MKKVYLETFGCQMNVSDSERAATILESKGFEITPHENAADVVLFNTCSVREKAEHKLYTRVGQIRKAAGPKPLVGILGCVAQLEGETLFDKIEGVDFVLGTKAVGRVSQAIENVFETRKQYLDLGEREADYDWTVAEKSRHSPYIAFVPIIEGCNKFCAYCIVPFSRGREKSLIASEIVRQVLQLRRQGVREVHLIGQNVNSYRPANDSGLEKFHGATAFSRLLRAVAATGIERVKFTTSFPRDFHTDIVAAIDEHENLCNWVHLPVQSGSDRILKLMRRGHTIENYRRRVDAIKNSPRRIALTTDAIIGFPGESDADFRATAELFDYCQYDGAYIFKYSPRPGTPAAEMPDDVSGEEKTRRFLELEKIQKANQMKIREALVGQTLSVLAEAKSAKNPSELTGHSTCHRVVNFEGGDNLLGKVFNVRVEQNKVNSLYGKVL